MQNHCLHLEYFISDKTISKSLIFYWIKSTSFVKFSIQTLCTIFRWIYFLFYYLCWCRLHIVCTYISISIEFVKLFPLTRVVGHTSETRLKLITNREFIGIKVYNYFGTEEPFWVFLHWVSEYIFSSLISNVLKLVVLNYVWKNRRNSQ